MSNNPNHYPWNLQSQPAFPYNTQPQWSPQPNQNGMFRTYTPAPQSGSNPQYDYDQLRRSMMTPGPAPAQGFNASRNSSFGLRPLPRRTSTNAGASSSNVNAAAQMPPPPPKLAPSLSCRQLFQQRLQKYGWIATFHIDSEGPPHAQKWIGAFYIKGTLLGKSEAESSKDRAKESAAKAALEWMNQNHYY